MRRLSSQYAITNAGPVLKRPVITVDDSGKIISIEDTGGQLIESRAVEFFNGIIIPGFVNCHCHLELSGMKGSAFPGEGLGNFILHVRNKRDSYNEIIVSESIEADRLMFENGISLCADTCNTGLTFPVKKTSRISYINLIEVFGIDADKAHKRLDEVRRVAEKSKENHLPFSLVPHSVYSVSLTLFRLLRKETEHNTVTSMHFMESQDEAELLEKQSGKLMQSYRQSGLLPLKLELAANHAVAVLDEVTPSGNLILVHNTFADQAAISLIRRRKNLFWCLCPGSNLFIEGSLPPLELMLKEGCEIIIGTDSLASNSNLSILDELKTLQANFPDLSLEDLVLWGTLNGARALDHADSYGKIEEGKTPGLLLLEDTDLKNMKLLGETTVKRLV